MRSRRPHFTPTQWVALILLAGGVLGTLALLAAFVYGSQLAPQPEIVAAVAARITFTPRPPTLTRPANATPRPSATFTPSPSPTKTQTPSPTNSPTITPTPTASQSPTPTPTTTRPPTDR